MVRTGTLVTVLICFGLINLVAILALYALYPVLPADTAFREAGSFEPSVLWTFISGVSGTVGGLAGGALCWMLLGERVPRIALLIISLVLTVLVAEGSFVPGPQFVDPAETVRTGASDFPTALRQGHTPFWVLSAGATLGIAATMPLAVPSKRR